MSEYSTGKKVGKVYCLDVWLMEIEPRIWRRLAVRPFMKLDRLHMVVQKVMGWTNSHLHQFIAGGDVKYSEYHPGFDRYDDGTEDECLVKLSELMSKPKDRIIYEYDFGDGWKHTIELTAIEEAQAGVRYPVCLAGGRACPPEDCGGPWGYPELLETLAGEDSDDREEYIEWLGGEFDPEAFDVEAANRRLRR